MKHLLAAGLFAAVAAITTTSAWAHHEGAQAHVDVRDPWVRATVAQQKATGAFMQLTAREGSKLVEVRSPVAGVAEVHEMAMEQNVMKMRALPAGLALPAGKTVELKPGGYHVMLMDLKGPVKAGDVVPVTLVFEGKDGRRESVDIKALVRPLGGATAPAAAEHGGHGGHKH